MIVYISLSTILCIFIAYIYRNRFAVSKPIQRKKPQFLIDAEIRLEAKKKKQSENVDRILGNH